MSYVNYIVLYDIADASKFNMKMFLDMELIFFDSIEEAFEDIEDFVHKYNYLMSYNNKDLVYEIQKTKEQTETHLEFNESLVVGQTINKEFHIVIKKIHSD